MSWDKFRRQLASEVRDYLADLHDILEDLKQKEGWIALGLVLASMVMTALWFISALGFSPANEHVSRFLALLGQRPCKPLSNLAGAIIFVNLALTIFLAAVALGSAFGMLMRLRRGLPNEPRELIISSSLLLVVGITGIVFMRMVC